MASSSTSFIHKSFMYDVFLSFRGEDTRTNFVDHLYHALQQKGIRTYKDDERITKGKQISDELIGSIEDSKLYIIVFSKNYASSSWCLDELVKIMECQKTTDHTAYPVFYDVEPTEVRHQSGAVKKAFKTLNNKAAAGKWRMALKEAAALAGWELKKTVDRHEAKFIQKIIEELSLELRAINFSTDKNLVGMETRINDVISSLETSVDDVRMIGIKGMGGGGKTTLARAIFDKISVQFKGGASFVHNVREVSKASSSGLKSLQNQILSDVIKDQGITLNDVYDGKNMMMKRMPGKKVLLVLDDVDHIEQPKALAGERDWFMPGSRIIITTRDEQVLIAHGVNSIHNIQLLLNGEAICLFSRYAFGRVIPNPGYEELSQEVVNYAAGLPLTIEVLGSFLCGKNDLDWIDALKRLRTIPLRETLKKLEISYDSLEEDYKEIFLNVACMRQGWSKATAIKVLESCGLHARNGLKVLEQKSLVTVNHNGYLDMHDHIEEMGKDIVRRSHPDKPFHHSRLWINKEIEYIFANDSGTEDTRYIRFSTSNLGPELVMKGLRNMKELRFLDVSVERRKSNGSFPDWRFCRFPDALRYLHWGGYPFRSLPNTFKANNLVALEMAHSGIEQLWEGGQRKDLNKLRFLDLCFSELWTLDLGLTPNIETLNLLGCSNLVELHMLARCARLVTVDLGFSKLRTLDLCSAHNLELLHLKGCSKLVELHMPRRSPKLRSIELKFSKLKTLDIGLTPNLEHLDLEKNYDLEKLHMGGECHKLTFLNISCSKLRNLDLRLTSSLKNLDLRDCNYLEELQLADGCLRQLVYLDLSGCLKFKSFYFITEMDAFRTREDASCSTGRFAELHLTADSLDGCSYYMDMEASCSQDESYEVDHLTESHLSAKSLGGCRVRPGYWPKIQFDCYYKDDQSLLTTNLEKLIYIGLYAFTNLDTFSKNICGLQRLRKLKLKGCISEVPEDLGQLECLEELDLSSTEIKYLPDSICMLKHLESLELDCCWLLEKLPENLGRLECLKKLTLSSEKISDLPNSICMLTRLESLDLNTRSRLKNLPRDLGRLECLKKLTLSCQKIRELPDSICMLKHLEFLDLGGCSLLGKLPEDIGRLECLKKIILSSDRIEVLPDSICKLKHLESLGLRCWSLKKLPEDLGRLECLKYLHLNSNNYLRDIPDSICKMKCLKHLSLRFCYELKKLPEELGHLECLEELDLIGSDINHLPQSISLLKSLHIKK